MDEPEIRMWAWKQAENWHMGEDASKGMSIPEKMRWTDALAAWVMSGTLPPKSDAP